MYTKTGDEGQTSLYSGERIAKSSVRVDAYGSVDELQAALGLARALTGSRQVAAELKKAQQALVRVMAELATVEGAPQVHDEDVSALEQAIDRFSDAVPAGFSLVVPGDSAASAALHVARTVARRCERAVCRLNEGEPVGQALLAYCNRLSDLCYVLARYEDEVEEGA